MSTAEIYNPVSLSHISPVIELLAPAKNLEYGKAAIMHGADAVYIGGPAFGARANAGNSIADIAELAQFAHQYHAQVFVTLNTILTDAELALAQDLIWQIYEAGADALIVQDMGILGLELPPIALHASTQMDNRSPEKVTFLEQVGFSQVVLARELNLSQIRDVAAMAQTRLEFFIHGALCVSYSGQCYVSHAFTNRSANKGQCSQMCRLPADLTTRQGEVVAKNAHLLSLKDNNQTDNLAALIDAGIRSFKIEGRLKDISYVKNITAHYRQQLDKILAQRPDLQRSSHGLCSYNFTPDPEKSFNRGKTDYFVNERTADISNFSSPKYVGEKVGTVVKVAKDHIVVSAGVSFNNGDGLCYFVNNHGDVQESDKKLQGMRVNRAAGEQLFLTQVPSDIKPGMQLYRNHDQAFEALLSKDSSSRKIGVSMQLSVTANGFNLALQDAHGHQASASIICELTPARDAEQAQKTIDKQLAKLGSSDFVATDIRSEGCNQWFIAASALNGMRRDAITALQQQRLDDYQRPEQWQRDDSARFPANHLSYLGNVINQQAKAFYQQHGVIDVQDGYELNTVRESTPLMITKHCLRYSYNLCPNEVEGIKAEPMVMRVGGDELKLIFDCQKCEMLVVGATKQP